MTAASASTPRLERWLAEQRWFARTDGVEPAIAGAVRAPVKRGTSVAVLTVGGDRYQLIESGGAPDAASDPAVGGALARFVAASGRALADDGSELRGRWIGAKPPGRAAARPLGAEQSNTSIAVGGSHVLKVLRRVSTGVHPELEVGAHLAGSPDAPVAQLAGWYDLVGRDGSVTTLGLVHELVPGALDGWGLVLSALAADPGAVLVRLRDLGVAVARLHGALARPGDGGTFGIEPLAGTAVWALADRVLTDPSTPPRAHGAIAHAVEGVGDDAGAAIRTHGDLHLGQTVVGPDGWVILDFEGEPARSLDERRARTSPLRDVAGMLRSFSYAAAAHERAGGRPLSAGWESGARAAFLDGYLATVDPGLLPRSMAAAHHLLTLLELEKVVYELAYERAHRPDWEDIPARGLDQLLDRTVR
ncbi:MAG: phosphotransferase [Acidimicrobiales bacterium]